MLERLFVIWCHELLEEGARGEEARRFARVVDRAGELCPWSHPVRLGVCALPARGPSRFFGGEEAGVGAFAEDDTGVVAELLSDLAITGVYCQHGLCAVLQHAVGKAPGRSADVDAGEIGEVDGGGAVGGRAVEPQRPAARHVQDLAGAAEPDRPAGVDVTAPVSIP